MERRKNALITSYLIKDAFTKDVHVNTKDIALFAGGVLKIRECRDYNKVWNEHFK